MVKQKYIKKAEGQQKLRDRRPYGKDKFVVERKKRGQRKRSASLSFERRYREQRPQLRNKYNKEPQVPSDSK